MQNNTRKLIKDILYLWSSKEEQLKYQKNVPTADVSSGLFCQWVDDYYHPNRDYFKDAFTQSEIDILEEFNFLLNYIFERAPDNLPKIDEFIETKEWKILSAKARNTLNQIF